MNDFYKFAISNGISSNKLDGYSKYAIKNGYLNPTILEERALNVIGIDIFSRLMLERILFLGTEIDSDTSNIINSQLLYLNSIGDDDIKLYINSPGGSVNAGLAIYDTMNIIQSDVSTYCMGMAASMGAVLVSSGAKGKRWAMPHGEIMIHQPMGGAQGQASDIFIEAEQIRKCQTTLYNILAENTGKTFDDIKRDADRDKWFDANEAKNYGLIDEIITKMK